MGKNLNNESKKPFLKKLVVFASFTTNLCILFYFKYINFLFDLLKDTFNLLNISINTPTFDIILPVGISFYTFQALSYTIDVYKRKLEPSHDIIAFFAFISFFANLMIIRNCSIIIFLISCSCNYLISHSKKTQQIKVLNITL